MQLTVSLNIVATLSYHRGPSIYKFKFVSFAVLMTLYSLLLLLCLVHCVAGEGRPQLVTNLNLELQNALPFKILDEYAHVSSTSIIRGLMHLNYGGPRGKVDGNYKTSKSVSNELSVCCNSHILSKQGLLCRRFSSFIRKWTF